MIAQRTGAGMAGHEGVLAVLDHIPEAALGQMAGVDDHTQFIHLGYHFQTEGLQTQLMLLGIIGAGEANGVFIVPGQADHTGAAIIELLNALDLAIQGDSILDGQQSRQLAFLHVLFDVSHAANLTNHVGIGSHFLIKGIHAALPVLIGAFLHVVVLGRAIGGNINSKALNHAAALLQLFQIDVSGPVLQGVAVNVNGHQGIAVQVKNIHRFHHSFLLM